MGGEAPLRRVLVCGGRDFADVAAVKFHLESLPQDAVLVHGAAPGADRLAAHHWHITLGRKADPHPADWHRYGRAAGPIRNQEMLDSGIDLVIAFPGGIGTKHMVSIARKAGVPVRMVNPRVTPSRVA